MQERETKVGVEVAQRSVAKQTDPLAQAAGKSWEVPVVLVVVVVRYTQLVNCLVLNGEAV